MRVMVLHPHDGHIIRRSALGSVCRGHIVRMHIAGEGARHYIEQPFKMPYLLFVIFKRFKIFQVTYMLALKNIVLLRQAEARLLLRPAGEDAASAVGHLHREGNVSARAARGVLFTVEHPAQRIITAGLYFAVVQQEAVRDAVQLFDRLGVFIHDWRVREIRARHNEHVDIVPEQQVVQRRIRQHHANVIVLADVLHARLALLKQNYRAAEAVEYLLLIGRDAAYFLCRLHVAAHYCKRLLVALLAATKRHGSLRLRAGAGQMHTAQPLDGDYFSVFHISARKLYRVALKPIPFRVEEEHLRPADGTAVGLGVIASVLDVVVFPVTVRAHRELAHRGLAAIIRYIFYYSKAWTAISTIYKRVAVSPVVPVAQFAQAVVTDADIRRYQCIPKLFCFALENAKIGIILQLRRELRLDALYHRQLRRAQRQSLGEAFQRLALTLQLQLHSGGSILDKAAQAVFLHKLMDERAETDPLHNAVNGDLLSFQKQRCSIRF